MAVSFQCMTKSTTIKKKKDVVHICNGILFSHQKAKIVTFAAKCMDLKLSYWMKSDRENISYHLNMESKKKKKRYKWTYLQKRNRVTDVGNKLMVTRGKKKG